VSSVISTWTGTGEATWQVIAHLCLLTAVLSRNALVHVCIHSSSSSSGFMLLHYTNRHSISDMLKVKGPDVYLLLHIQGKQNSRRLQCKVAYWSALAIGSAAQLVTAILRMNGHCTRPAVCS